METRSKFLKVVAAVAIAAQTAKTVFCKGEQEYVRMG
jgi:hypothetical protein